MDLARTHRRLTVLMGLAGLLAFAGGAGVEPLPAGMAAAGLVLAFFWQPSPGTSTVLERISLPVALLLASRALTHVFVIQDDVVIPVVDLLLLLLVTESLRSLDTTNDSRLYSLSFALLLAATAYRPGLLFGVAFVAYVGLATVTLVAGHLRRKGEGHGHETIDLPPRFLLATSTLAGATLLIAAVVFVTFPRVTRGWAGRGRPPTASVAGFSDQVTLGSHGAEIRGNPRIYLRVEFPGVTPPDVGSLYWRGRSYDRFDGMRWSRSRRMPPSLAPEAWYEEWGSEIVTQKIYASPLDERILFALHPLLDLEAESRIQPVFDNAGDYHYWGSAAPVYTAYSVRGRPSAEELRQVEGRFSPARPYYVQLPPLSDRVRRLADSLLAPLETRYDRAAALVEWFEEDFTYTLTLPATPREATLEHFLLDRRAGHCEYFSTAMAILLRTQGVPTREVNGFLGGEWSRFGDYLAVTGNQAHSWVEVWFPDHGWVPFDPTPPGTAAEVLGESWLWPGRFLFDGLQHRWNKWVLDYSAENQWGLLRRGRDLLPRKGGGGESEEGGPAGIFHAPWWWAALLLLGTGGLVLLLHRRRRYPPPVRLYLRLREAGRRAGVPRRALHSPLALVAHLESIRHPAAPPVRIVVDGYLRFRFAGEELSSEARDRMARAVRAARSRLRKTPSP